jgi:hypothetical protein
MINSIDIFECYRCGRYDASRSFIDDWPNMRPRSREGVSLACYLVRKLGRGGQRPKLESAKQFEEQLTGLTLSSPKHASDLLIAHIGDMQRSRPGIEFSERTDTLACLIGFVDQKDVIWLGKELKISGQLEAFESPTGNIVQARLSLSGWDRYEQLKKETRNASYAFMARKFINSELDDAFQHCLQPAVKRTGYYLRIVTQKAGLIDSIIEAEIRNCKYLIADLSDQNAGAYWEAGLAEGLGKPVFYVCKKRDEKGHPKIHFDTEHRMTIDWDPGNWKFAEDDLSP